VRKWARRFGACPVKLAHALAAIIDSPGMVSAKIVLAFALPQAWRTLIYLRRF
jgi:hypothetical protein